MLRHKKDTRDYTKRHERRLINRIASQTLDTAFDEARKRPCIAAWNSNEKTVEKDISEDNRSPPFQIQNKLHDEQNILQSTGTKSKKDINCYTTEHLCMDIQSNDEQKSSEESYSLIKSNDVNICGDIATWAVNNGISHSSLENLLKLLRHPNRFPQLPAKAKTLFGNPINGETRYVEPGYYWHNGLKACLNKLAEENYWDESVETLLLSINIDGLPLFKSSGSCVYPILGSIFCSERIFLIGCYHGYKKPQDFNNFLQDFVDKTKDLITTGYNYQGKTIKIEIYNLICDALAKAAVLNVVSHTGYYSCTKCTVKGNSKLNRVYFTNTQAILRSNRDFLMQTQKEHHRGISPLTLIPNFGPISNVPLDYMHVVCLGVMREMLLLWLFGKSHLRRTIIDTISEVLLKIKPCIPKEFCRKPRSLEYIKYWKATEFRQFLLYIGPIALADVLPKKQYKHFCVLHVAIRILSSPELVPHYCDYANELLKYFVQHFEKIYGDYLVSHNVHCLIHLAADVKVYGVLDNFSAFKFENYLQQLKRLIRKASQSLQQLCRRYQEIDYVHGIAKKVQKEDIEIKLKFHLS
ncbi:uncharacterized protein LOC118648446 isoform X1 [Monomorium pharaonis]|uniref:uncharacterized protein LOC118648446 isoform X1 n=1 Tax=Monomorium pharaonis TaxID=307658 RepID=UPI0017470E4B|nr:uncharacterized protein LOC118648446 isoform X1 [Monomorium pharaonis]XP_036150653.1 uncharacterized protein LOC118648446 isoform X1 [Monomorium pharaonis]